MSNTRIERIEILPGADRFFKSLKKNKPLRNKFQIAINELQENPFKGKENKGDLSGVFTYDFWHDKSVYELAYILDDKQDAKLLIIILAGTRGNFYNNLKRYMKTSSVKK